MSEPEIFIKSWDDPSLTYGVKDAETFYRVYGHDSRFYIASGPDMDQSIKDYYTALTPNLPNEGEEKGAEGETGIETVDSPADSLADLHEAEYAAAPSDSPADAPVSEPGSPEF